MNIIILRFSSGGDLILITGIIDKLLKKNLNVTLVVKKRFKEIFEGFKNLRIIEFEEHEEILGKEYDYAFDLQKNLRSFFMMRKIKAKRKFFANKRSIKRRIHLYFRFPLREKSFIKIFAEPFERVFQENFYLRPVLKSEKEFKGLPEKYILIAPFSSKPKKDLSHKVLKKILENESKDKICIIVGDKKSKEKKLPLINKNIIDIRGETSLRELFYVVKKSSYIITVDSMISHIASAYEKEGFVIFGPTTPLYGFYPYGDKLKVIHKKIPCSPCSLHGEGICLFNKKCYEINFNFKI